MRKTPVVLGVLSMVFGGVQLLYSAVTLASAPLSKQMMGSMGKAFSRLPHKPGDPDMGGAIDKLSALMEELKLYTYLTSAAMVAFSITLILVGWLLYKRRVQSRKLAVTWAIAALAYLPVQLWIKVKIILPPTQAVTREMLEQTHSPAAGMMDSFYSSQGLLTVIGHLLFYAPFPILLIWLMGRQSAKNDLVAVP